MPLFLLILLISYLGYGWLTDFESLGSRRSVAHLDIEGGNLYSQEEVLSAENFRSMNTLFCFYIILKFKSNVHYINILLFNLTIYRSDLNFKIPQLHLTHLLVGTTMTNEISIISLYQSLKLGLFDLQLVHLTIFVLFFYFLLSNKQDVIFGALLIFELGMKFASEKR